MYISGGENVYPAEVEAAIAELPQVGECAVIGVPDERWGEVGLAIVEPQEGAEVTLDALVAHIDGKIARFKYPKHIATIEEMPRNTTLKIDRALLKKTYGAAPAV